ncbi:hypothetical protein Tco_0033455 [Tanacetum coccineum]
MKKYDYGHLEEIEVRREDQQLYTFREGDFPRLRLQDIEDMLLLLVQQKLSNLTIYKRYDLNVALLMFTRRIVIQRRVEDLQLGVESYQKKLNLTIPDSYRSGLRNKNAYTSYSDPQGVTYVDQFDRKRLMRTDELTNSVMARSMISYALSWKPCQGDSLNLPDHRAQVDQGSQIKMIQVKEMMQDNDLKNSKSKDKGSKSRSQSMDEQNHYKQDKTITRQSINVKRHTFNVIGGTEEFEERDLNIGGDC